MNPLYELDLAVVTKSTTMFRKYQDRIIRHRTHTPALGAAAEAVVTLTELDKKEDVEELEEGENLEEEAPSAASDTTHQQDDDEFSPAPENGQVAIYNTTEERNSSTEEDHGGEEEQEDEEGENLEEEAPSAASGTTHQQDDEFSPAPENGQVATFNTTEKNSSTEEDHGGEEEQEDEDNDNDGAPEFFEEHMTSSAANNKKRKIKKRIVGSPSESIKQMKDAVVRTQAIIAATKVSTIQAMTTYAREKQNYNNPRSQTVLLSFDEIVERPDKMGDGERQRDIPMWTLLLPNDVNRKDFGVELEKLGKALQADMPKPAKRGAKKRSKKLADDANKPAFNITVAANPTEYLASIYGPDVESAVAKKMKAGNNTI